MAVCGASCFAAIGAVSIVNQLVRTVDVASVSPDPMAACKRFTIFGRTVVCLSVCLSVLQRWIIVAKRLDESGCQLVRR